jgi:hypothetical protein
MPEELKRKASATVSRGAKWTMAYPTEPLREQESTYIIQDRTNQEEMIRLEQHHALVYRAGTEAHQEFYEDMRRIFHLLLPFFQKWTRVPSDYEGIYQQALREMQEPDFVGTMAFLTAWGTTPKSGSLMKHRQR